MSDVTATRRAEHVTFGVLTILSRSQISEGELKQSVALIAKAITEAEDEMIDRAARIIAPKPRDAEWLSRLTADARARIKDSDLEAISCAHAISNLKSKQGT